MFVKPTPAAGNGLAAATAVVVSHGYSVVDPAAWEPEHTLRVLLGARAGSQQAFLFVGGRYIGTDTAAPSRAIQVLHQEDTTITLGYDTARGQVAVRFHWNGSRLDPLDPIPPAQARR